MSDLEAAIHGHHARNRELLQLIADKGADPNLSRRIDLHFWASSENAARKLAAALEARGYLAVSVNRAVADDASLWNVEANVHAAPRSVVAPSFVEDLSRLAASYNGEFDGWGTSI
jgi:regulator of RNase E activity RraB